MVERAGFKDKMNTPEIIEIGQLSQWDQLIFGAKCASLVLDLVPHESRKCASDWIEDAEAVVATRILQGNGGSPGFMDEHALPSESAWMAARICSYAAAWWNTPRPDMIAAIARCAADANPACIPQIWQEFEVLFASSGANAGATTGATISLIIFGELEEFGAKKSRRLIEAVEKLLDTSDVHLYDVRRGSIEVYLSLPVEQAEKLFWAIKRGELKHLDVVDAYLIGDATANALIEHKRSKCQYDVFLCHNSRDKCEVKSIGERLMRFGLFPWLDEWALRPGFPWQRILENEISQIRSAAVFVGCLGTGPWQDLEIEGFIRQFVKRSCPVIPVLLSSCSGVPELPMILEGMTWVDFRKDDPSPLIQLIWGITGQKPETRWKYY